MCLAPQKTKNGLAPCRDCWSCRANKLDDISGRALAEARSHNHCYAVTLTYRGDGPETEFLTPSHPAAFFRAIRDAGTPLRYLCSGEYGSLHGRAHWHAILYFDKEFVKDIKLNERMHIPQWPWGFVYFQRPDYHGIRYVLKYSLKQSHEGANVNRFTLSKKPLIGSQFITDYAHSMADAGAYPRDFNYTIPNVYGRNGSVKKFYLSGASRRLFLTEFRKRFTVLNPFKPLPDHGVLDEYKRKLVQERMKRQGTWELSRPEYQDAVTQKRNTLRMWGDLEQARRGSILRALPSKMHDCYVSLSEDGIIRLHHYQKTKNGMDKKWDVELTSFGEVRRALAGTITLPTEAHLPSTHRTRVPPTWVPF